MEDKLKVIFIEDDPNLGLIIVLALQSKGYEVHLRQHVKRYSRHDRKRLP